MLLLATGLGDKEGTIREGSRIKRHHSSHFGHMQLAQVFPVILNQDSVPFRQKKKKKVQMLLMCLLSHWEGPSKLKGT